MAEEKKKKRRNLKEIQENSSIEVEQSNVKDEEINNEEVSNENKSILNKTVSVVLQGISEHQKKKKKRRNLKEIQENSSIEVEQSEQRKKEKKNLKEEENSFNEWENINIMEDEEINNEEVSDGNKSLMNTTVSEIIQEISKHQEKKKSRKRKSLYNPLETTVYESSPKDILTENVAKEKTEKQMTNISIKPKKMKKPLYNPESVAVFEFSPESEDQNKVNKGQNKNQIKVNKVQRKVNKVQSKVSKSQSKVNDDQNNSNQTKLISTPRRKKSNTLCAANVLKTSPSMVQEKITEKTDQVLHKANKVHSRKEPISLDSSDDEHYEELLREATLKNSSKVREAVCDPQIQIRSRTYPIYNDNKNSEQEEKNPHLLDWHISCNELKKKGVIFQTGFWSQYELDILKENVKNFEQNNSVKAFSKFLEVKSEEQNFIHNKENIFITLSEGIKRPIRVIRNKIKEIYLHDYKKDNTKFTDDEVKKLLKLAKKYPNQWSLIGRKMGRSLNSVFNKYSSLQDKRKYKNTSPFSHKEDEEIKKFVASCKEKNKLVSWKKLGKKLSRQPNACKNRWKTISSNIGNKVPRKLLCVKVARAIINANISDPKDVNWLEISKAVSPCYSPSGLSNIFSNWFHYHYRNKTSSSTYLEKLEFLINHVEKGKRKK